jgi:hypothetical protein
MYVWFEKVAERLKKYLKSFGMKLELLLRGRINMVDMYVVLILNKRRTIDQVPEQWKELVLADLRAIGVDGYGNPLPTELD